MTQTPSTPAEEIFPIISVNFDFYVGLPSDLETGRWEIRTVQNDVIGRTLTDVDGDQIRDAEEILRGDLKEAGTEFVFTTSAGYNLAEDEQKKPGTQIYLDVKIQADDREALLSVLEYLSNRLRESKTGEINLDSDDHESAITASSEIREDEAEE